MTICDLHALTHAANAQPREGGSPSTPALSSRSGEPGVVRVQVEAPPEIAYTSRRGDGTMPATSLPVEHLFTLTFTTAARAAIEGGPNGTRRITAITGGTFAGPKVRGTVVGSPGGDWLIVRPDGSLRFDVRLLLQTEDGAAIFMAYSGIGVANEGSFSLRTAPQFETADARYAWLNTVQAVGVRTPRRRPATDEVYALL